MTHLSGSGLATLGTWSPTTTPPIFQTQDLVGAAARVREPLVVVRDRATGHVGVAQGGRVDLDASGSFDMLGALPALYPEWLGDRGFCEAHGVRFPYVTGAMANGIATARLVIAMARANMLGFFGAGGLSFHHVERGLDTIISEIGDEPLAWGANLIHSPNEPALEERVAALYIERGVPRVSAAAYMKLTPSIVRYAYSGLGVDAAGNITRKHHVFAKISRSETAVHFMSPAPEAMLRALVEEGKLTAHEAELARHLPVAEDIIVESDSGGHTDNRPLSALLPDILAARDAMVAKYGFTRSIRVGAAGGMGTPTAVASAFAAGAAFVLTGSVNQSALESGLSDAGREMLAKAGIADVIMAPAADMFELGVEVQVLKRGTMFGPRGKRLHDIYHQYGSLSEIPADVRAELEKKVFGASFDDVWADTARFWGKRDPEELERAQRDPRHQMALVFRWYLGKASKWAIDGEPSRKLDYQIWCGPAMGSFNTWVKGSFLEPPTGRHAVQIALNLLEGAAIITRAHQLRTFGVNMPAAAFTFRPRPLQ